MFDLNNASIEPLEKVLDREYVTELAIERSSEESGYLNLRQE